MRKILSLLLALVMLIALWPAVVPSAHAAGPYDLWIQGVRVTDGNRNDVLNDGGSVTFDPETLTLTLTNASITGAESPFFPALYCGIYSSITGLTLELVGENTITCVTDGVDNHGIYAWDLTIQESDKVPGVLTVTSAAKDSSCSGVGANYFTMRSGTLVAEIGGDQHHSIGISSQTIQILGGTLSVESTSTAPDSYGFDPWNSHLIIGKGASVTAIGQTRAFSSPVDLTGYDGCTVTVNTEATEEGAVIWNGTDPLGGEGSAFRFSKITGPLESIKVTKKPDRTEYTEGDFYFPDDIAVTAYFAGGGTRPAIPLEWSPGGPLTPADKKITISFTINGVTRTTDLPITVTPAKVLNYIELSSNPAKLIYAPGEIFESAGMKVTAHYLDGSTADVTGSAVITCDEPLAPGSEVYVNYTEGGVTKSTTVPVRITELSYLELSSNPAKLNYIAGEIFNPAGMKVTAHYTDGSTADVTGFVKITPDYSLALDSEVYVNYSEGSITKAVQVPVSIYERLAGNVSAPGSVDYTVKDPPTGAVLIGARYNGGRMTAVKTVPDVKADGTITLGGSGTEYKLFLVNGSSYKPLCPEWHS